nr:MAG: ORF1 [Torque teno midi virus]
MPFWWRRRRKPWFGRWRYRRRLQRRKPRYRRRRFTRRRNRRLTRRRRRKRYKVRRKKKTIPIRQWQPDSIVNCKIKGFGLLVLGAEGKQMFCWTPNRDNFTPPLTPCGGGFGVEQYTLSYLYEEFRFHRNIWTKTNMFKDLCRYLWVQFTFYRHPETDFIIAYERQPPFPLDKLTYTSCHPTQLLLGKHKRILPSTQTNPKGRTKMRLRIKPPKQMITKWFFTQQFCKYTLLLLKAAAINLNYSYLGMKSENQQVTIIFLNMGFYINGNWGKVQTEKYKPWATVPNPLKYHYYQGTASKSGEINLTKQGTDAYYESVNIDTGYFKPTLLQAYKVEGQAQLPTGIARYNPNLDEGPFSKIWLCSSLSGTYDPPMRDSDLLFKGLPLWLMLWGWFDYLKEKKNDPTFLNSYYVVITSPAIHFWTSTIEREPWFIPIDRTFYEGKAPYKTYMTDTQKKVWIPLLKNQMETLNAIAESGPFVPKYSQTTNSTWELKYNYTFHFKWGGPEITDQQVEDPSKQNTYPVPDTIQTAIQIQNPEKQTPSTFIHAWDIRRGIITQAALKRMCQDLETDTDFEPDAEYYKPPKKKKRQGAHLRDPTHQQKEIQECLLSLCEEPTYQEAETQEDLHELIKQQQQQQLQLKRNILQLITDLKTKQQMLQLQTGIMD